jgi:hypothetical protein
MKSYNAYDLSRNRFMNEKRRKYELRMVDEVQGDFYAGFRYMSERYLGHGRYEQRKKPYVKRCYRGRSRRSYSSVRKHMCNRQIRHTDYADFNINHGAYRRLSEYWWEID